MRGATMKKEQLRPKGAQITPAELKEWRLKRGWTQEQAADRLGVTLRTVENWEQGYRPMRHPATIRKVMDQYRLRKA